MNQQIIYGSEYGTTRRYAEQLSQLTGIPAMDYTSAKNLDGCELVIYLGGLYAGGVKGLKHTVKRLPTGVKLILVTVACFFVVGVVMLISFLLLYASVRITCINIRNGAKMELNNLSATIYADTYRSQRETNFEEYLRTLYSSNDYTEMLEATVAGGLAEKIPLSTEDYEVSDISLEFNVVGDRVEYIFYCDVDFYIRMFGHSYPTITQRVELTGYHNTKF